jgi:hypothetical protein
MNGMKRTQMIEAADLGILIASGDLNHGDHGRALNGLREAVDLCRQAGMEGRATAVLRLMERVIRGDAPRSPEFPRERIPGRLERWVDQWLAAAADNAEAAK